MPSTRGTSVVAPPARAPGTAPGRNRAAAPPPGRAPAAGGRCTGIAASAADGRRGSRPAARGSRRSAPRGHGAAAGRSAACRRRPASPASALGEASSAPRPPRSRGGPPISRTRSPPRSSSDASASSSSSARSRLTGTAAPDRQSMLGRAVAPQIARSAPPPTRSRGRRRGRTWRWPASRSAPGASPGSEGPVLPEAVALADPPAAVHALRHRGRDPLRPRPAAAAGGRRAPRPAVPAGEAAPLKRPARPACRSPRASPTPSARAEKFSAMRCRSTGVRQRGDVVEAGRQPPVQHARGRGRPASAPAPRAARAPGDVPARPRPGRCSLRPAAAHQGQDRVHHLLADRHAADQRLRGDQLVGGQHRRGPAPACAPVVASSMVRSASRSG